MKDNVQKFFEKHPLPWRFKQVQGKNRLAHVIDKRENGTVFRGIQKETAAAICDFVNDYAEDTVE